MIQAFLIALQLFNPAPLVQRSPDTLMAGTWESCLQDDGDYSERALDFTSGQGIPWFEIHYGPRDEFAIFAGNASIHIPHYDDRNLLRPAFHYDDIPTVAGGRNWFLPRLGIHLNVIRLQGPTGENCQVFLVLLERDKRPTWVQP